MTGVKWHVEFLSTPSTWVLGSETPVKIELLTSCFILFMRYVHTSFALCKSAYLTLQDDALWRSSTFSHVAPSSHGDRAYAVQKHLASPTNLPHLAQRHSST